MYKLAGSPVAMPTGYVVLKRRRPYIWEPDSLPYHVIDETTLRIWCPEWNKKYASRIDHFVPMWREAFTFRPNSKGSCPVIPAAAIWDGLKAKNIQLEPPEPLDRFLGRSHVTVTAATN